MQHTFFSRYPEKISEKIMLQKKFQFYKHQNKGNMRKPAEHGNVVSSIILGVTAVLNAILLHRDPYSIIFWVPIWTGLFIFDIPLPKLFKNYENMILIILIVISSIIAIVENIWIILPYSLFFTAYLTKLYFARKRMNFISVGIGILGYTLLFSMTWLEIGYKLIIITGTLFLFMLGSEFLVRAIIQKRPYLLLYNFITIIFVLINPSFVFYVTSLIRIIVGKKVKKIKTIGIIESFLLLITIIFLEITIVYKII